MARKGSLRSPRGRLVASLGNAPPGDNQPLNLIHLFFNRIETEEKYSDNLPYFPDAHFCITLSDLLPQSDFVVLCTPLTSETRHLIAAKELSLMKPTATLVNIARGGVVNHDDLTDALKNGVIRAAALDVTEPEPLPRDHPLLKMANVTLTPHFGSATANTRMKMVELAVMNLRAGLNGKELPFGVN